MQLLWIPELHVARSCGRLVCLCVCMVGLFVAEFVSGMLSSQYLLKIASAAKSVVSNAAIVAKKIQVV